MDLPGPGGGAQPQQQQQQRPSLSYFLFLSLLIYLMNQNQVQTGNLVRQAADGDASASHVYRAHQTQLLYREARRHSIARWLGIDNSTNPYLASKYYPDIANGSAPAPAPVPVDSANGTTTTTTTYTVPTFVPTSQGELAPVHSLVTELFAARDPDAGSRRHLHLQNLTGFAKGSWLPLPYSYADLGLNETWLVHTIGRTVSGPNPLPPETSAEVAAHAPAPAEPALARRQTDAAAPALRNETDSGVIPEIVTYNRTLQRGTFPWIDDRSTSPPPPNGNRADTHRATFNLRSLQTSATGPVLLSEEENDDDGGGQVLRVKELSAPSGGRVGAEGMQDWEKLGPVVYVGGKLTLHAPPRSKSGDEQVTELDVEAVHFLDSGRIFGYATPEFARARIVETISLPLMSSTSGSWFASPNLTAVAIGHAMLKEYDFRLERDVKRLADADEVEPPPAPPTAGSGGGGQAGAPPDDADGEVEVVPRCIFTMYGALSPLPSSYTRSLYAEWYSNLFHPTGARVVEPPATTLSAVLASPNCGLVLSVPSARVTPTQQLWNAATSSGALLVAAEAAILLLQVRQLERVQGRPGTIAHVSHYGVVGMLFVDAYAFVTLLTLGVVFDSRASLSLLAAAFMSLLSSLLFGTRYIAMIREATPDRTTPTPPPPPQPPVAAAGIASLDGTALNGATEGGAMAAMPHWLRGRLNGWTLRRTRKVLAVTLITGFALYLINWHGWTAFILWIIYSHWIPQIVLNVWRGTARQSLADEYVIGMTLARIGPPLYFWAYEGNCLLVPTTPKIWYLAAYYCCQAAILVLQSRLASPQHQRSRLLMRLSTVGAGGARFFLPKKLAQWLDLPPLSSWDYHPRSLPPAIVADLQAAIATAARDDLEAGRKSARYGPDDDPHDDADGRSAAAAEPDCPICLTGVHVFPTKEERANGEEDRVRMAFAVTPCAHLVHTECLEQWVMVRSICPVCRASLPPLGR